jgi:hypothetical protein
MFYKVLLIPLLLDLTICICHCKEEEKHVKDLSLSLLDGPELMLLISLMVARKEGHYH